MVEYKSNGKCKAFIREEIKSLINEKSPLKVFTLPNLNFEVENFALKNKSEVTCCEIDKNIYRYQLKRADKRIRLINEKMSLVVRENIWDLAWLDACGPISKELIESLKNVKISDNGDLIITVGSAREHYKYKIGNRLQFYTDLLNKLGLYAYKIYKYKDHKFPMLSIFCTKKRVNKVEIFKLN